MKPTRVGLLMGDPALEVTVAGVLSMQNMECYNHLLFTMVQGVMKGEPSLADHVPEAGPTTTFGERVRLLLAAEIQLIHAWMAETGDTPQQAAQRIPKYIAGKLATDTDFGELDAAIIVFKYKAALHAVTEGKDETSTVRVRHDRIDEQLDRSGPAARRQTGNADSGRGPGLRGRVSRLWGLLRRNRDDSGQFES